jgi:probable H4MPT-linked C1 transfer pathway protein
MTQRALGLDIGGANIKAAAADGRAWSEPFALWKDPDGLAAVLNELLARFPGCDELAVTLTGELCDCFATKREGVGRILDALFSVSGERPIRVWGTDGQFHSVEQAKDQSLSVAAANWHALATHLGRTIAREPSLLIDIGSTTADIIPILDGVPATFGKTDYDRLRGSELVYTGVRRTPVMAVLPERAAAEYFAGMHDVYLVLGMTTEDATDTDTADQRPATAVLALARLARMLGGDCETLGEETIMAYAVAAYQRQLATLSASVRRVLAGLPDEADIGTIVISGSGEFLARRVVREALPEFPERSIRSLHAEWGEALSACAPAYACALLADRQSVP